MHIMSMGGSGEIEGRIDMWTPLKWMEKIDFMQVSLPQKNEEMNILVIVVSMLGQKQQGFYNDTQPI